MGNEIATVPHNDGSALMAIIERAATSDDFDVSKMKELLELKRSWDRDRAAEAFGAAIARFQQLCPRIHKSRTVNAGPLNYQYASFDDVMAQATPHLTDCGIAVSFSTEATANGIRVTCRLRVGTHAEDYTLDVPVPDMRVNQTQRYGAALSYAKRYALCAALNIVVTDDVDDDANSVYETIDDQQELEITALIDEKNIDRAKFLKWMGVESVLDIPAKDYRKAMDALRRK